MTKKVRIVALARQPVRVYLGEEDITESVYEATWHCDAGSVATVSLGFVGDVEADVEGELEEEDPLAAGFARFMNRPREERHGER